MSSDGSGSGSGPRPRRRWSRRIGNMELMVKSMLDLRQLESFAMPPSPVKSPIHERLAADEQLGSTISLQTITAWVRQIRGCRLYGCPAIYLVLLSEGSRLLQQI